jgi:hypothetical protein
MPQAGNGFFTPGSRRSPTESRTKNQTPRFAAPVLASISHARCRRSYAGAALLGSAAPVSLVDFERDPGGQGKDDEEREIGSDGPPAKCFATCSASPRARRECCARKQVEPSDEQRIKDARTRIREAFASSVCAFAFRAFWRFHLVVCGKVRGRVKTFCGYARCPCCTRLIWSPA